MARPRLLTAAMTDEIALHVELGGSLAGAADRVGCSARSLRRWLVQGNREVADLSEEARLALQVARAQEHARALSWEHTAALLEQIAAESLDLDF